MPYWDDVLVTRPFPMGLMTYKKELRITFQMRILENWESGMRLPQCFKTLYRYAEASGENRQDMSMFLEYERLKHTAEMLRGHPIARDLVFKEIDTGRQTRNGDKISDLIIAAGGMYGCYDLIGEKQREKLMAYIYAILHWLTNVVSRLMRYTGQRLTFAKAAYVELLVYFRSRSGANISLKLLHSPKDLDLRTFCHQVFI